MWFIDGVEVEQETSAPPPKKNPGSAPDMAYLSAEETSAKCYTKQVKSKAGERFIHDAHSFMSVSFYTYLCI